MDPWTITPQERARHEEQFRGIGPAANGMVSGGQARGFMMQSGLPPMVLAQVWGLADMNGDGQMDINEFSIACKLITNQLKGVPLPKTLPPSILVNPNAAAMASQPMAQPMAQPMMQPMMMPGVSQAGMMPAAAPIASAPVPAVLPMAMPGALPGTIPGAMPVTSMAGVPGMAPVMAMQPGVPMTSVAGIPVSGVQQPMMGQVPGMIPAAGMGMMPGQPPSVPNDWAVPMPSRAKYQAQFTNADRNRTGFLAGAQARNLLLQSGLPQNVLAQIWGLSDVDNDGRLSVEEFVLAGHLCELALKGEPLPPAGQLPPCLVPPSLRSGTQGGKTPGTPASGVGSVNDTSSPSTFEDKRRENFNKGQAELQKRRESLIEAQKKEKEERERKEKEEAEAREKQKQELERQRLAEWEKQRKAELVQHRQREQEKVLTLKAKQDHLNSQLEGMREKVAKLTSDIGETRTGVTDVKCFIDGMRTSRDTKMKEMADLKAKLKDQNQRLLLVAQEKAKLEAKNKTRQAKVDAGNEEELTEFEIKKAEKEKHVIELREKHSDLKIKEMEAKTKVDAEKAALEEHREKLRNIIEACKALYNNFDDKRREVKAEKAKRIRELTDPDHAWNVPEEEPEAPVSNAAPSAGGSAEGVRYRAIYDFESSNADELPFNVGDIIMVREDQEHEPGWLGGELNGKVGWFPEAYVERVEASGGLQSISEEPKDDGPSEPRARALFDWKGEENNHLSLTRNEIITVTSKNDPNWWHGVSSSGIQGYFPSNFVMLDSLEPRGTTPTDLPEVPTASQTTSVAKQPSLDGAVITAVAIYPYQSEEVGDLSFEAGETIIVIKKEAEWWTGKIGERSGVFPYNYVEIVDPSAVTAAAAAVTEESIKDKKEEEPRVEPDVAINGNGSVAPTVASETTKVETETGEEAKPEAAAEEITEVNANDIPSTSGTESESEGKSKKPEIATVVAPYTATSKEQLTLQRGQMVLVRKKTATGWWQGELQGGKGKKRQLGWFPATYVKLMGESGGDKEAPKEDPKPKDASNGDAAPKFKALFSYGGQHDDELSFEAGDIITLISKEEEAWWKGELNGKCGVFPSNYVEQISSMSTGGVRNVYDPVAVDEEDFGNQQHSSIVSSPSLPGFEVTEREKVIKEIINTERGYLDALQVVKDVFIRSFYGKHSVKDQMLSKPEMQIIFINWKEVYGQSNRLFKALKIRERMSTKPDLSIGDILCEHLPNFKCYVRFCASQTTSATLLQKLIELKPGFNELLNQCQQDPRVRGMPLPFFLLKPVKRITEYPILLEKLLRKTPKGHPDYSNVYKALGISKGLCDAVDEGMYRKENSERLEWLQLHVDHQTLGDEAVTFNSMTNNMGPRRFLLHGSLKKVKSGKELVAFLFNDFLLLTLPSRPIEGQFSFEKHHDLELKSYRKPVLLSNLIVKSSEDSDFSEGSQVTNEKTIKLEFDEENSKRLSVASSSSGIPSSQLILETINVNETRLWCRKLQEAVAVAKEQQKKDALCLEEAKNQELKTSCGRVLLLVLQADDLGNRTGKVDPYLEASLASQSQKTQVVNGTNNPKWNASMQFFIKNVKEDILCLTVFDKGYFSPDEFLGRTEIRLEELKKDTMEGAGPVTKKLPLYETDSGMITIRVDIQLF